jgi:hypothetical protein
MQNLASFVDCVRVRRIKIKDLPEAEPVRLSQNTQVEAYTIGFDLARKAVIWKLPFNNDCTETYFLAPAVAVHFTKGMRKAARKYKWLASQNRSDNAPAIIEEDWDFVHSKFDMVTAQRTVAFHDGLVSALPIRKDLFR